MARRLQLKTVPALPCPAFRLAPLSPDPGSDPHRRSGSVRCELGTRVTQRHAPSLGASAVGSSGGGVGSGGVGSGLFGGGRLSGVGGIFGEGGLASLMSGRLQLTAVAYELTR